MPEGGVTLLRRRRRQMAVVVVVVGEAGSGGFVCWVAACGFLEMDRTLRHEQGSFSPSLGVYF